MLVMLTVLFLSVPSAADADARLAAHLELMKLAFACSADPDRGAYRAARDATLREIRAVAPLGQVSVREVTDLDRALRAGTVKAEDVDIGDCDNLLTESRADIEAMR